MLGGLFGGTGGDDGGGIVDGGTEVRGEERAADGEVDGGGLFGKGRCEEEVYFGLGGEGGV